MPRVEESVNKIFGIMTEALLTKEGYKPVEQDCMTMERKLFAVLNLEKFVAPKIIQEVV
jgi:hypothetical protein